MSCNCKFLNPDGVYFTSFAVVEWLDGFTSNELVSGGEYYLYSSAADYAGEKGILDDVIVIW